MGFEWRGEGVSVGVHGVGVLFAAWGLIMDSKNRIV